jgi:hypothetical protein
MLDGTSTRLSKPACSVGLGQRPRRRLRKIAEATTSPTATPELRQTNMLLDPDWRANGLFQPLYYDGVTLELCVYGAGIHCNRGGVWYEALSAADSGSIAAARGLSVLTFDGRLFIGTPEDLPTLDGQRVVWRESTSGARFSVLTAGGAIGDGQLWRRREYDEPTLCPHEPPFIGGDLVSEAIDEHGIVYLNRFLGGGGYSPCRWQAALQGIIDESYLYCGITRNWLVLTSDALLSIRGRPACAID